MPAWSAAKRSRRIKESIEAAGMRVTEARKAGWQNGVIRMTTLCSAKAYPCTSFAISVPLKNKKAAPPRSLSERSEQLYLSASRTLLTTRILESMTELQFPQASAFSIVLIIIVFAADALIALCMKLYSMQFAKEAKQKS